MGWGAGSHILREVWNEVGFWIPQKERAIVLSHLIKIFWDKDCDTFDDLIGEWPELEEAMRLAGWIDEDDDGC